MRTLKQLIALWACFLVMTAMTRAVEVTEGPEVVATESAVTVRWKTDVACGTQLKFGLNANNYNRKAEGPVGVSHEVQAGELRSGTTYFYSIGTAKRALKMGSFTTKGSPPNGVVPPAPAAPKKAAVEAPPAVKPAVKPAATRKMDQAAPVVPPTAQTWGDRWSLQDHYNRHGADFGAQSPDDYAAKAWLFLQQAKDEGLPAKLDESDGTIRVWEGRTHTFAAYNRNFKTKTFFKPGSPDYFKRQPGKLVRLQHAPTP